MTFPGIRLATSALLELSDEVFVTPLLLLLAGMAHASIIYQPYPLQDSIADAPIVAHVRIKNIQDHRFRDGSRTPSCGRDYVVDVLQAFKGKHRRERTFSVVGEPHAVTYHEDQVPYGQDCSGPECAWTSRRMLPWAAVEAEIQRWSSRD